MNPKINHGHRLQAYLSKFLADAGGAEDKAETTLVNAQSIKQFTTENERPENEGAGVFPENPWYVVLLIVALIGVLLKSR